MWIIHHFSLFVCVRAHMCVYIYVWEGMARILCMEACKKIYITCFLCVCTASSGGSKPEVSRPSTADPNGNFSSSLLVTYSHLSVIRQEIKRIKIKRSQLWYILSMVFCIIPLKVMICLSMDMNTYYTEYIYSNTTYQAYTLFSPLSIFLCLPVCVRAFCKTVLHVLII